MHPYSISSCFILALVSFSDKLHCPLLLPNLFLLSFPFARPNKPCCYLLSCSWRVAHSTAQRGCLCCGLFQLDLQTSGTAESPEEQVNNPDYRKFMAIVAFFNVFVSASELMFLIIEGIVSTRSYS